MLTVAARRALATSRIAFAAVLVDACVVTVAIAQTDVPIAPACKVAAPLEGHYHAAAPGYIVVLKREVKDPAKETARLAARHRLAAVRYLAILPGFSVAALAPELVAVLRCEPTVRFIEHDSIAGADNEPSRAVQHPPPRVEAHTHGF